MLQLVPTFVQPIYKVQVIMICMIFSRTIACDTQNECYLGPLAFRHGNIMLFCFFAIRTNGVAHVYVELREW